ncbi:hypothetical protein E3P89_01246 [Wallemia ichthyophaga]|uniref:T6SS Phospholipase effector Tle1-like catalytic domain-containing protein n=2 Tax=Wallemia ichthyophaga TaxID=245174 RepID=A0A4T0HHR6_WALIC|nr:uncharacterized protein J056_001983 [Wallemia ichthyophaga EXF-994]TIA74614.1 hypothetical protein E3P91_00878 [Wallemia ichthyophaga]EOR03905.1 hypothetical protein J056_001983 [Wallemia ichthyophaga EXF-994]TIA83148.1 hypothetical protein E3P98_01024 [Wallemia ichthyophaga]TIB02070.1 hypothetical protein E3P95_01118 [Wallemia ichthyophaga]TIB02889.1 hypothetical protein E3P94_01250 [Wallemia ichthyophaga]
MSNSHNTVQDLAVHAPNGGPPITIEQLRKDQDNNTRDKYPRRLIVCCDGTWQDGLATKAEEEYTNILRLTRAIRQEDRRHFPPTPQICHYVSGVGTGWSLSEQLIGGATGNTLGIKIRDAYAFLSQNYCDGDEIFLFGFSRGAFTARTLGALINDIGILNNKEMEHFFEIFKAYHDRNDSGNPKKAEKARNYLEPWLLRNPANNRHKGRQFIIKCIGVFDTVGALGVPSLSSSFFPKMKSEENYMGFPDTVLGDKVEHCYHALSLHENRPNFVDTRLEVKKENLAKGQHCKQVWFTGCHSDIGGSYREHELSDLTLIWMCASIEHLLLLDIEYLRSIPNPMEGWGKQQPHDSRTGIFTLGMPIKRKPVLELSTTERLHPSVLENDCKLAKPIQEKIDKEPQLIASLLPLEEQFRAEWKQTHDAEDRKKGSKYHTSKDKKNFDDEENESTMKKYWDMIPKPWNIFS